MLPQEDDNFMIDRRYMLISLLIFPAWAGYQLTFTLNQRLSIKARLLWGFLTGHVLFTWLVFLLSFPLGFNYVSITSAVSILFLVGIWRSTSSSAWKKELGAALKNIKR